MSANVEMRKFLNSLVKQSQLLTGYMVLALSVILFIIQLHECCHIIYVT